METYKQGTKEKSRVLLWEHAIQSLTQCRNAGTGGRVYPDGSCVFMVKGSWLKITDC